MIWRVRVAGWGSTHEHETRTPTWLLAGDIRTVATLVGLPMSSGPGGVADAELVARWLDDGIVPNGAQGARSGSAVCTGST